MVPPDFEISAIDLSIPDLPPRSRLFALRPVGLGTDHVEGLTSYLTRLARAHAVSPRRLVREELVPACRGDFSSAARRTSNLGTLDGLDRYAEAFAAATAELTTVKEVRFLTLLPLAGVLPACGAGVMATHPRWCDDCWSEAREKGEDASRPLVWSLDLYRICHRHGRPLSSQCPRCGAPQTFLPCFPDLMRCLRCGGFLVADRPAAWSTPPPELWMAKALADLVAHLPMLDDTAALANFHACLMHAVLESAEGNRAELCRRIGMPRPTLANWLRRGGRPRLRQLLLVSYGVGIMPADLLLPHAFPGELKVVPAHVERRALRARPADLTEVRRKLASIADDPTDNRPLLEVARTVGWRRWRLKYWFPEEYATIGAKHARASALATAERRRADYQVVADVVRGMLVRGQYPGRRKVTEQIYRLGMSLSRPDMLEAYRETLRRLHDSSARGPVEI